MGKPQDSRGLWGVAYGRGRYVAVGMNGLVLTSEDGRTWEPVLLEVDSNLWGVAFGQDLFVAVGDHVILVSRDGAHYQGFPAPGILNAVAFAQGLWVAVGWGGLILTSQDGRTWQRQVSGTWKGLFGITRGRGLWVAVGEQGTVLTSPTEPAGRGQAWRGLPC